MRYLKLRTEHTKLRACGTAPVTPIVVDSPRKFAPSKERRERIVSKTKCQLIYGAHDSGKTRWLSRMQKEWHGIWGAQTAAEPLFLGALHPVSSWTDQAHIAKWHDNQEKAREAAEPGYLPRRWAQQNQQQRAERLADYLADTGAVLFVDDAHKLTGRKLQIARACVLSARLWLITCSQENRLPPNLRPIIERREPQRTRLLTDASYDATGLLIWLLIVSAMGAGWWEASLIFGGLKLLGNGRRAARSD